MQSNPKHLSLSAQMGCFWSEVIMRAYQQMSLHKQKKKLYCCLRVFYLVELSDFQCGEKISGILIYFCFLIIFKN